MTTDNISNTQIQRPNELTAEEAKAKRKYHLALAGERAHCADMQGNTTDETGEAMLATFILPGD